MLPFPSIDPYLINTSFVKIRWYGLMYLLGITLTYWLAVYQLRQKRLPVGRADRYACCFYAGIGLFIGARLGQALFYKLPYFLENPLEIASFWKGGMSSHGSFVGVTIAVWLFVKKTNFYQRTGINFWQGMDIIIPGLPLTLGLVRIGNFINGSLFGRATDVPWGMIFPGGGNLPRHPSQVYQFLIEGALLFIILWTARNKIRVKGGLFCLFLVCHGIFRFCLEFFKEPEVQPGFILYGLTRGQILSVAMLMSGLLIYYKLSKLSDPLNARYRQ